MSMRVDCGVALDSQPEAVYYVKLIFLGESLLKIYYIDTIGKNRACGDYVALSLLVFNNNYLNFLGFRPELSQSTEFDDDYDGVVFYPKYASQGLTNYFFKFVYTVDLYFNFNDKDKSIDKIRKIDPSIIMTFDVHLDTGPSGIYEFSCTCVKDNYYHFDMIRYRPDKLKTSRTLNCFYPVTKFNYSNYELRYDHKKFIESVRQKSINFILEMSEVDQSVSLAYKRFFVDFRNQVVGPKEEILINVDGNAVLSRRVGLGELFLHMRKRGFSYYLAVSMSMMFCSKSKEGIFLNYSKEGKIVLDFT